MMTIDLKKITYGFIFIVTMKVKNKKTGIIYSAKYKKRETAREAAEALNKSKVLFNKYLEFVEFIKVECTGKLAYAFYSNINFPDLSEEEKQLIPIPESYTLTKINF